MCLQDYDMVLKILFLRTNVVVEKRFLVVTKKITQNSRTALGWGRGPRCVLLLLVSAAKGRIAKEIQHLPQNRRVGVGVGL